MTILGIVHPPCQWEAVAKVVEPRLAERLHTECLLKSVEGLYDYVPCACPRHWEVQT